MNPKEIVENGYDHIAEEHEKWTNTVRVEERAKYTAVLFESLLKDAKVLELGCGSGIPTTKKLAEKFSVTGVDISSQQIALAEKRISKAKFIHADMTELEFPENSFDAITAFYSIIHVPREEQAELLCKIASWLRPGGLLVISMGAYSNERQINENWLGGLPMYWSNFDSERNRQLVEEAGLKIISAKEETAEEHGKPVTFLWVVAQKPDQKRK
ncbi:MAG: methyltransferase domain-containing protein [Chloroflexi bacterium]|nr:methyltransferase domain-containing protein [Chloroflexota bacterium]